MPKLMVLGLWKMPLLTEIIRKTRFISKIKK
jgi:hypothetical protein